MRNVKDYEIINKLGEGSYGVVYKVKHPSSKSFQVLKQINMSKMSSKVKK